VECGSVSARLDFVEGDYHVWKISHEPARNSRNCSSSDRWRAVVHAERAILGEKRRNTFRILTAPRLCITRREVV
jgi:hypothetical protein